ncbi:hypothetical protein UFOVP724_69 [uncultured Caudovirales phage]|uniref:Uncharacterized protein n=1 Tax=uncultured Caudovirales phage TaxID=2100421 RepID=A0A6J5NMH8_9CAUD|nr:hypothetical protein UFOVP724_69 [uncultured Caudovirales phage]
MDLGQLYQGYWILPLFANIIAGLGIITLGYLTHSSLRFAIYYLKYKTVPTNEIEYKYLNLLEENKFLKQKITQLENEQNELFESILNQMKNQ